MSQPQTSDSREDATNEFAAVPPGWKWAPLSYLATPDRRVMEPGSASTRELPYLGLEDIESGSGRILAEASTASGEDVRSATFAFDTRHVLYGKLRPYLNKVAIPEFAGRCSTELVPLLPAECDRSFLAYLLRRPETVAFAMRAKTGSRMPRTDMQSLLSMPVLVPPLAEQHRIVAILDEAAELQRLRREADRRTAELVPAIFDEMFGDPATNPKGWPLRPVSHFAAALQGGKSLSSDVGAADPTYKVLRISAVTSGNFRPGEAKPVPAGYQPPSHHVVRNGDLLFSRANTTELVGATAYVTDCPPGLLLPDKLWRFVWRQETGVQPLYVWALLSHARVRQQLGALATGTSGSMQNISQKKLLNLSVPFPPADDQGLFAQRVERIRELIEHQAAAAQRLEALSRSLLERAFTGDLN